MIATDQVARRARNFFVFAGAIIVYLFAGADLEHLTVMGLRVPSDFPVVFSAAAVFAMVWFWWRYFTAWLDSKERASHHYEFLLALHESRGFHRFINSKINLKQLVSASLDEHLSVPTDPVIQKIYFTGQERFKITIAQLDVYPGPDGGALINVLAHQFPGAVPIEIDVPFWRHYIASIPCYWFRVFRYEHVANQVLPHVALVIALGLVVSKLWFKDPSGLFGFLTESITDDPLLRCVTPNG